MRTYFATEPTRNGARAPRPLRHGTAPELEGVPLVNWRMPKQPPEVPTFEWAVAHAQEYLRGELTVREFGYPLSELLDYYKELYRDVCGWPDDDVYEFVAFGWGTAGSVLRGTQNELDLAALLEEMLPGLRAHLSA